MAVVIATIPSINIPLVDTKTGLVSDAWYRFFESLHNRTGGGNTDKVEETFSIADNAEETAIEAAAAVDDVVSDVTDLQNAASATEVMPGNGLSGGGIFGETIELELIQDAGWTPATGTPNKGAYGAYGGVVVSVTYDPAEQQARDDALAAAARRLIALESAMRVVGVID